MVNTQQNCVKSEVQFPHWSSGQLDFCFERDIGSFLARISKRLARLDRRETCVFFDLKNPKVGPETLRKVFRQQVESFYDQLPKLFVPSQRFRVFPSKTPGKL